MRASRLVLAGLIAVAACARSSGVLILDARALRDQDNHVITDVQLEAVEQGGGRAGHYCVSVHTFNFGFNPLTQEANRYLGELDVVEQCDDDLADGDQRVYRLVSTKTDLIAGLPMRVQVSQGGVFRTKEGIFSP